MQWGDVKRDVELRPTFRWRAKRAFFTYLIDTTTRTRTSARLPFHHVLRFIPPNLISALILPAIV